MAGGRIATPLEGAGARASTRRPGGVPWWPLYRCVGDVSCALEARQRAGELRRRRWREEHATVAEIRVL
jgi:3'-phosphoadenosine 5'-phosphosulfate sulfotransferase (PAPS reductase)/FAD synthetase